MSDSVIAATRALQKLSCAHVMHPWTDSCSDAYTSSVRFVMPIAFPIYVSVYLVPGLLSGRPLRQLLKEVPINALWSTLFLSAYGSSFILGVCMFFKLAGRTHRGWNTATLPGMFASLALLLERKSRRPELAVYMLNEMLYACWQFLSRKIALRIPLFDVLVFCCSLATMTVAARFHPSALKGLVGSLVRYNMQPTSPLPPALRPYLQPLLACAPHPSLVAVPAVFVRGFALGWGIRTALQAISSLVRRRLGSWSALFASSSSLTLGMSLGSMAAIFKALESIIGPATSPAGTFVFAVLAGLPFAAPGVRSLLVTCYMLAKALETCYRVLADRGLVPYVPHGDLLVYMVAVSVNMNFAVFNPHMLEPGYWNFLKTVTEGRFARINRHPFALLGWSSKRYVVST